MNLITRAYLYLRKHFLHIDDRSQLEIALANGLVMGSDCQVMGECIIDPGHCWLIELGDNVTLAPRVHILAHDASTKRSLGYTVIGKVVIGSNVFIGAGTTILPNVVIGDDVIVGAGSVVTHSIPSRSVYAGNPARYISATGDYLDKRRKQLEQSVVYDETFQIGRISDDQKAKMKSDLSEGKIGFIV